MIEWIGANVAAYGPLLVGVMALFETALIIGLVLPTEPTIIVATAFALEGHFSFSTVVVAALAGAALGDSCGFVLGRFGRRRFLRSRGRVGRMARRHQDRTSLLFERHGVLAISLARMIPFARTLMPLAAGSARLSYRRFLVFDLLGVAGWAMMGLGFAYGAARGWEIGVESLGIEWAAASAVVAVVLWMFVMRRLRPVAAPGTLSVGLTGNIAAGKSAVADYWASEGVPVASADELSRAVVKPGSPGLATIVEAFGNEVLSEDGALDRRRLRKRVFEDAEAKAALEGILHPRIWVARDRWMRTRLSEGATLTVAEVPLLFEVGLEGDFDVTVVVDAPANVRLARLTGRRGLDPQEARKIMASQMDPDLKREKADHLIRNSGSLRELEASAARRLSTLRKAAKEGDGRPAPGRLRIDLHTHTRASFDCRSRPERVIAAARAKGVERIAITDHNRLGLALDLAREFPDTVIPGEEVKTAEGIDVIGLYLLEEIPKGTAAKEVCRRVKEQGGLVYLPHPYAHGKGGGGRYAEELAPLAHVIEVFNARLHPGRLNEPAEELAARWGKARGAGSDAHTVGEVAAAFVEVEEHPNEPAALLRALETARVRGVTAPWSVHLASTWAKVSKKLRFFD